jgi:ABC-type lipopolysaccharide export system ATPase subunit
MKHKLEADSIHIEFGGRTILSDIYLHCQTGWICGLLGRNGQGKSSLMKIIYGILPSEKSVRFNNIHYNEAYKQNHLISYLPDYSFIPKSLSLKRVFEDFEVEYSSFEKLFPEFVSKHRSTLGSLSGGGKRIVELFVIIKTPTLFAFLDEPFSHISPIQIEQIKDLLLERKNNKGFLITDHMYKHVIDVSDKLYVLVNGKLHLTKSIEDIETLGYVRINQGL